MAAPELNDDAVAEILLRLPPDDPAALFRAALVCKPWLRIVFNPAFLRDYRAFHRGAPLLGFFYHLKADAHARFVSTTAACPLPPAYEGVRTTRALDCRHGRVLIRRKCSRNFVVLNPITGGWVELQQKPNIRFASYSAVVLCAVAGCNHGDCGGGPFLVVCVGNDIVHNATYACVYSSKDRAWGTPVVAAHLHCRRGHDGGFEQKRAAVIGDAMYCTCDSGSRVVRYDLVKGCFCVIGTPRWYQYTEGHVLMQNEDGSLGYAGVRCSRLELWSRMANLQETAPWVKRKAIELRNLLPTNEPFTNAYLIGFAEGAGIFFIRTIAGSFTLELKSERATEANGPSESCTVFPLFSFFTPDSARRKLLSLVEKN